MSEDSSTEESSDINEPLNEEEKLEFIKYLKSYEAFKNPKKSIKTIKIFENKPSYFKIEVMKKQEKKFKSSVKILRTDSFDKSSTDYSIFSYLYDKFKSSKIITKIDVYNTWKNDFDDKKTNRKNVLLEISKVLQDLDWPNSKEDISKFEIADKKLKISLAGAVLIESIDLIFLILNLLGELNDLFEKDGSEYFERANDILENKRVNEDDDDDDWMWVLAPFSDDNDAAAAA